MQLIKYLCVAAMLFSVTTTQAKSPVWKVSKGDKFLFIGGTIHLLSKKDYPLPAGFDVAFQLSEELVFETDVSAANSLATQTKFLPVLMYQDDRTIESVLSKETFELLSNYLEERKLPASMFYKFTPAGLTTTLTVLELQKMGIDPASGVENHMNRRASDAQKDVAWLESIEEQIALFNRINQLDADMVVRQTIKDMDQLTNEWPKLLSAWRNGDLESINQLGIADMLNNTPELYAFMLSDRNQNWVPQIKQKLDTPEIEFIMVGALHLAGKDSVLRSLEKEGYTVEQME